jgi:alkanesulfonate monooxygenase SsuD/methylene tetrahydromethanopterin reductase-like flavin-dependent oxidoreductase (luciferase family)
MPIRKDVFIADDGARAEEFGNAAIEKGYRGGQPRGSVAFGSVDAVTDQLAAFAELGFTDIIIRTMMGVPQADAVRSIELAGDVARNLATD